MESRFEKIQLEDEVSRARVLAECESEPEFDIAVIGGGIHGAAAARSAALQGLRVILLEAADYAAGTSSRSSKMAHGGLRYLEMFDFKQVFEGIKAREELFQAAEGLVRPERFLIPVTSLWMRIKLGIGLFLYDLMVSRPERKHRWISKDDAAAAVFDHQPNLIGCYEYSDGLMSDARIVLDSVLDARRRGAACLNYARVVKLVEGAEDTLVVFSDELEERQFSVRAKAVLNCAGPWVTDFIKGSERPQVRYSRGVHLIFTVPWNAQSLFLPMPGKSRYYFVWPHPAGTMVGTTEREVDAAELDPKPSPDEVAEILARLTNDLPDSNLNRETLHYAFAGVRTLPLRGNGDASRLSRRHIWKKEGRVLSLLGGKFTTAWWTASEGVGLALNLIGLVQSTGNREQPRLPSAIASAERQRLSRELVRAGLTAATSARLIGRYGARADLFLKHPEWRKEMSDQVLLGEIELSLRVEQAVTIEDIMRRRLELEYQPGNGLKSLEAVADQVNSLSNDRLVFQLVQYKNRIMDVMKTLKAA